MAEEGSVSGEAATEDRIEVQGAEFGELVEEPRGGGLSLDLVLDISMPITVELGRASMTVRELLDLSTGSVIELDTMAGEPIDLFVRGVRFARGDVVVVDNNFGLRISEVINPQRSIPSLGKEAGG